MALPAVFADGPRFSGNSLMLGSALFLAGSSILATTIVITAVRKITSKEDPSLKSISDRNGSVAQLDSPKPNPASNDSFSPEKAHSVFEKTLLKPLRSFASRVSSSPIGRALCIASAVLILFTALPPPVKTALLMASKFIILNLVVFLKPGLAVFAATCQTLAAITMSVASTILMPILSIAFVTVIGVVVTIYAIRALYNKFIAGMNNMKEAALSFPKSMKDSVLGWGDTLLSQIPGYRFVSSFFKSKEKPVEIVQTSEERRAAIAKENRERWDEYYKDEEEMLARARKEQETALQERRNFLRTPSLILQKSPLLVVAEEKPKEGREGFLWRKGSPVMPKPTKA